MNLKANSQTADSVSKFQNLRFSGEHQEFDDSKSYIYQLTQIFGEIFGERRIPQYRGRHWEIWLPGAAALQGRQMQNGQVHRINMARSIYIMFRIIWVLRVS